MTTFVNGAAFLAFISLFNPATARPALQSRAEDIQWGGCPFSGTLQIMCGNVSVPMDYTKAISEGNLTLQLVKVPAVREPSSGSLFLNPGGPGTEAQRWLADNAKQLLNITGGTFHLIAFDPRGTGTSIPFSCYDDPAERLAGKVPYLAGNSSDTALGQIWAQSRVFSDDCQARLGNTTGSLVGTTFVARDLMRVVDALGGDGLLRYWGFSYGTVLGMTIAAMFPERIDRMVLDGNVNPHEYYHGIEMEAFVDSDKVLRRFTTECVSSPNSCDLAKDNITSSELEIKIYDLLNKFKYNPAVYRGRFIDYFLVKKMVLYDNLYQPTTWKNLATMLAGLMTDDFTALDTPSGPSDIAPSPRLTPDALLGIRCSDKDTRASSLEEVRPDMEAIYAQSRVVGDVQANAIGICAQWQMDAQERYGGNFTARTQHPILFIGNTLDPITPLVSARNASAGFEGSVVLEHKGVGHTSQAQKSNCTNNWIKDYFETGNLPPPGTACEVEGNIFGSAGSSTNGIEPVPPGRKSESPEGPDSGE